MDFLRRAVSGRIVSAFSASLLVIAACGPAGQATPTSAPVAPAATTAPAAPTTAPASTGAGAQPTAAAKPPGAPVPTVATTAGQPKQGGRVILGDPTDIKTLNPVLSTD